MKIKTYAFAFIVLASMSCETKKENKEVNPLLSEWNTPFGTPPFDLISSEHYLPAINEALVLHKAELKEIENNKDKPTFANTVEALELSGATLNKVQAVFYAINAANTNDILKETAKTIAPKLASHSDDINLNKVLFTKVKELYLNKEELNLEPEQLHLLNETYKQFVRAGADLNEDKQENLRTINSKLASLSQSFGENLLEETNAFEFHTEDKTVLGNLPSSLVELASSEAKKRGHDKGWSITTQRPSINPFLQSSTDRDARKVLFDAYAQRANNGNEKDNKKVLQEIVSLRVKKANLLGYKSHSDYVLSNAMAEKPEAVLDFMSKLWAPALEMAKQEIDVLAAKMKQEGVGGEFGGSDWRHYVEKVRKERYAFDEEQTRPYFEFTAVREGVFALANKLFGLSFVQLDNVAKWHEDQQVFEVLEKDGSHLGLVYMDFFARESKRGGAWMNAMRSQMNVSGHVTPIVTNNFNYPAPTANSPSLLSFGEAETLFHEFGHALHGLFSKVKYRSLSGTNVPRDFVEFPSQVMENWMSEPEVLKMFAKHYQTGEVIPDDMIEKMKKANSFNGGFGTVEYMAAAYLDIKWHSLESSDLQDVEAFEKEAMKQIGLIEEIIPRYRSTYFAHIFSGGYSSGYYSYLWSEVLDADAFKAFKETGDIFDQTTAAKYRKMLSQGGSKSGMELYKEFRGAAPEIEPLLIKKGFILAE